jgi:hypothetical protein
LILRLTASVLYLSHFDEHVAFWRVCCNFFLKSLNSGGFTYFLNAPRLTIQAFDEFSGLESL